MARHGFIDTRVAVVVASVAEFFASWCAGSIAVIAVARRQHARHVGHAIGIVVFRIAFCDKEICASAAIIVATVADLCSARIHACDGIVAVSSEE